MGEEKSEYGHLDWEEDFEASEINPGDVVTLKKGKYIYRVTEPLDFHTEKYSHDQIGVCLLESPSLGSWKLPRHIESHLPMEVWESNKVAESSEKQTQLQDLCA